jgi:hypothetical protein
MENIVDRFAMLTLRPRPRVTLRTEAHSLRLASSADLWYSGGGAFQPWTFGYQARSGGGAKSLANLYDLNIDLMVNAHVSIGSYCGYAAGKSVIEAVYPTGTRGRLAFLETMYRF